MLISSITHAIYHAIWGYFYRCATRWQRLLVLLAISRKTTWTAFILLELVYSGVCEFCTLDLHTQRALVDTWEKLECIAEWLMDSERHIVRATRIAAGGYAARHQSKNVSTVVKSLTNRYRSWSLNHTNRVAGCGLYASIRRYYVAVAARFRICLSYSASNMRHDHAWSHFGVSLSFSCERWGQIFRLNTPDKCDSDCTDFVLKNLRQSKHRCHL